MFVLLADSSCQGYGTVETKQQLCSLVKYHVDNFQSKLICWSDIWEFSHRTVADCSYQGRRSIGAKTPRDREVGAGCHSSAAAAVKYLRRCLIIAPSQLQQSTCKSKRRHKCPFPRMRFLKNKLAIIGGHHVGHYVVCEGSERLTEWKSFSFFRTPCRPPCRPHCPPPCRPPWPPTCQPSCRRFVRAQRRWLNVNQMSKIVKLVNATLVQNYLLISHRCRMKSY